MIARCAPLIAGAFAVLASYGAVFAHESRPFYIEVTERDDRVFEVSWKAPPSVPRANSPRVSLPDTCQAAGTAQRPAGPEARVGRRLFRCPDGLSGAGVGISYPLFNPSVSTLVRFEWASGETASVLAGPDESQIIVPDRETASGVARDYLRLGVAHILEGADHLLFLACLLFIAGTGRRILITVTGFTLAHSLTLASAALGIVRVPVPAVEAAIALSIVFLAEEIARPRRDTITWRYPILVSASFGLLHGFGFAAVLGEIGLPETEVALALLFFNVGVEVGQLMFVFAAILLFAAIRRVAARIPWGSVSDWFAQDRFVRPTSYAIGIVASYWMADRLSGFFA